VIIPKAISTFETAEPRIEASPQLTPFLKWPGGKSQELAAIAAIVPPLSGRLIDPFVGGGAVLLATPSSVPAWANDLSADLIRLYTSASEGDPSVQGAINGVATAWDSFALQVDLYEDLARAFLNDNGPEATAVLTRNATRLRELLGLAGPNLAAVYLGRLKRDLPLKFDRMRRIQAEVGTLPVGDLLANVEGAVRSAFYMAVRARYNEVRSLDEWGPFRVADFFFLREFSYAAMFRFNSRDQFNVPYGGISYNRKSLADKAALLQRTEMLSRLSNTVWRCQDFELFLSAASPSASDFVFIDPPYDSDFNDYDNKPFVSRDQERLHRVLQRLPARVMLVVKDTPLIRSLYTPDTWRTVEAEKLYMWTIKSRNDRSATHLTITNY
jgi:DNA adenine methylase